MDLLYRFRRLGARTRQALPVLVVAIALLPAAVLAQQTPTVTVIIPDEAAENGRLGAAVALLGESIVAGAPGSSYPAQPGAVHLIEQTDSGQWETVVLVSPDEPPNVWHAFGAAVAASGSRIAVGAPRYDGVGVDSGAVYVFQLDQTGVWTPTRVVPSDGKAGDRFGAAVSIDDDRLVVGAPGSDRDSPAGAVYLFEQSPLPGYWVESSLPRSDFETADFFGAALAVEGDQILVGAPAPHSDGAGAAFVYERDATGVWLETRLDSPDPTSRSFGHTVAIEGDRAVVGSPLEDHAGVPVPLFQAGAVYIFERNGSAEWAPTRITAFDADSYDAFGQRVAVDDGTVVIGAPSEAHSGSAYVLEPGDSGTLVQRKIEPVFSTNWFGDGLAVFGDLVVVGAWGDAGARGALFVYDMRPSGYFLDDDSSIFEEEIDWMAHEGLTYGCNPPVNDHFCPTLPVSRGQMAAFLSRSLGLTEVPGDHFVDDDGSIFESDIEKMAAAGITRGCNPPANNRFCPDDPVTRGQMAAFLVRALGFEDDGGGDLFDDDDHTVFEIDIDRLATAGVTRGCNPPSNTRFCPDELVTREQMAAFLFRSLN